MRLQSLSRLAAAAMALAVSACGSDDSAPGRINVRLVDGPTVEFKHVMLNIERVEISTDGGWRALGPEQPVRVDLLSLVNGVSAHLVTEEPIGAGHYSQLRLVLADAIDGQPNQIQLADGTIEPLVVPSGLKSGIKVNANFDVEPGATAEVYIDLDAKQSIFVHSTGSSGKYILRPRINAVAEQVGAITGVLVEAQADPAAPVVALPGVEVTAQKIGADGRPVIVRTATTGPDGTYRLDLLRLGTPYNVVAQPLVRTPATATSPAFVTPYEAKASAPIALSEAAPVVDAGTAAFARLSASGDPITAASIAGVVIPAPTADEGDWISVVRPLTVGVGELPFIVRMEPVATEPGVATFTVDLLPVGSGYSAWMTRSRFDGFGDVVFADSDPASFAVPTGPQDAIEFDFTPAP